jgi:hypothetical protein
VWLIHLNFRFLISIFISVWPDNCQSCLFELILGHQIRNIYLKHLLINVLIFLHNSFLTRLVSQPYKSTEIYLYYNPFNQRTSFIASFPKGKAVGAWRWPLTSR